MIKNMCAQFLIKIRIAELKKKLGIDVPPDFEFDVLDERILPYKMAPVIVSDGNKKLLKLMNFSLIPSWSKDRKVKFATHNARLETIAEKPTWKQPFILHRAIVPLSRFIEPIYLHQLAGNMVQFFDKKEDILLAAAIYDEWVDKKTGEVLDSFSIITSDPPPFIAQVGHDRCPVFLKDDCIDTWLEPGKKNPVELIEFLKKNTRALSLDVTIDRPLAKGWEKRIPKD